MGNKVSPNGTMIVEDPHEHPDMDPSTKNAIMWIDDDGILHVGDGELSWMLSPEQAEKWAVSLMEYKRAMDKIGSNSK